MLASALKLFDVPSVTTGAVLIAVAALAGPIWMLLRKSQGFPALPSRERHELVSDTSPAS